MLILHNVRHFGFSNEPIREFPGQLKTCPITKIHNNGFVCILFIATLLIFDKNKLRGFLKGKLLKRFSLVINQHRVSGTARTMAAIVA